MKIAIALLLLISTISRLPVAAAALVTFEGLLPSSNSFYNGGPTTNANGFNISGAQFDNDFSSEFVAWNGWSYSNVINTTQQDFSNQYAAWPGSGSSGSSSYGVAYLFEPTYISFAVPTVVSSADFANTTWTALSMQNGDAFGAKKYGGVTGNDPDYLLLSIEGRTGVNGLGSTTGLIDFYLGDYRSSNNAMDFLRAGWTTLDLSGLGSVQSLQFSMTSSDVGLFGINTPTYFAIDNISFSSAIPEPNSMAMVIVASMVLMRRRKRS